MADPFTIAVSVAGLASLGLQLADTLNKYAGSAVDSKGRAQAIREDIELAVKVFETLETTISDNANRTMMNDDSQKLAKEHVVQCETIFSKIQKLLPQSDAKDIRTRDLIRWPLIEPKLELLRSNLEKVKTTLQLLMNVVIFAAMSKRHAEQSELDQQRAQIQQLLEEKARAEAKLEKLTREHAHITAVGAQIPPSPLTLSAAVRRPAVPQDPDSITSLAMVQPHPDPVTSVRNTPVMVDDAPGRRSHIAARQPTLPNTGTVQEANVNTESDRAIALTDGDDDDNDPRAGDVMIALHDDYTACLRQLKALQSTLEATLDKLFLPTTGMPVVDPEQDAFSRRETTRLVEKSVLETNSCFNQRILDSYAHRTISRDGGVEGRISLVGRGGSTRGYGNSSGSYGGFSCSNFSGAGYATGPGNIGGFRASQQYQRAASPEQGYSSSAGSSVAEPVDIKYTLEAEPTHDEDIAMQGFDGYQYIPAPLYDGTLLQGQAESSTSMSGASSNKKYPIREEYPKAIPGTQWSMECCNRFEGVESSKGYYPASTNGFLEQSISECTKTGVPHEVNGRQSKLDKASDMAEPDMNVQTSPTVEDLLEQWTNLIVDTEKP